MPLPSGARLGPYEILGPLGAGGMGEVYRARDTRLDREVAVKVLRSEVAADPDRLRRFEREARTVAALNHPHILTVHDVGTHDGTPYVVTEFLEGETLRQVLKTRSPTQRQVLTFAVQIAQGLAAAHDKDIVHRDLKPENLFLTTDGRIKILDFGLAKLTTREAGLRSADTLGAPDEHSTSPGVILGTVAYMSPEQAQAHPLDNRSDIFSFGVVLHEMLAHKHPFLRDTAPATLTDIVNDTPPDVDSGGRDVPPAVAGIVRRCLEKEKQDRFRTTHDLALALEAVLQAPSGAASLQEVEERSPYPGLSSFTERDAAVFFGREGEVEALWRKLRSRHLLAVIGPSGAGKSSFVRAGILPARPEGWAAILCTPGRHPFRRLGQALGPALKGDEEALSQLAGFEDPETAQGLLTRWRKGHDEALVVVDQLEELFTQSPPEGQALFAELLGRLAKEADVHVLLSLRDDFLMRCHQHEPLARVFSELTPLDTLSRDGLRRAITEPAKSRGYAFEDDALVDEMVDSVEGARGALPLLAFAVSQLWERRDRETKRLTRAAYEEIGGVAGALAQHAEHTLERIGLEREPIVRELFRNLVTAQWTRAAADREELLSVLPDREAGAQVLDQLVDARLLTSYEGRPGPERDGVAATEERVERIEIVHESLLKAWPRLVRWQAQDEEGAVLRDQLKQAAHLWDEKGRTPDLLWSGTAHREFELWRERYPGALTAIEEDFARAMSERARRQRRRRRAAAAAIFVTTMAVAVVMGVLWKRARDAALRSEAGRLLALGQNQLEADTTAALAYARGSLDLFDTPEARRFALEVLWRGPVARLLPLDRLERQAGLPEDDSLIMGPFLSPDGRWLAMNRWSNHQVLLLDREGGPPRALPRQPDGVARVLAFGPRSDLLITGGSGQNLRMWSLPDLREIRTVPLGGVATFGAGVRGDTLYLVTPTSSEGGFPGVIQALTLPDGELRTVGVNRPHEMVWQIGPGGALLQFSRGGSFGLRTLDGEHEQVLGAMDRAWSVGFFPTGDRVAILDGRSGEIRILPLGRLQGPPLRVLRGPAGGGFIAFDGDERYLAQGGPHDSVHLWDLDVFPDARPAVLGRPGESLLRPAVFTPDTRWFVSSASAQGVIEFWSVAGPRRRELPPQMGWPAFTAGGRWLATCGGMLRLLPARARDGSAHDLDLGQETCFSLATHPREDLVLVGTRGPVGGGRGAVLLQSLDGGRSQELLERSPGYGQRTLAFDAAGERALASPVDPGGVQDLAHRVLRTWDLDSGRERVHSLAHLTDADWTGFWNMSFAPDGSLYGASNGGVRRLLLPEAPGGTVASEMVYSAAAARLDLSRDGTQLLVGAAGTATVGAPLEELLLFDLEHHTVQRITTHGAQISNIRLSPSGRAVVTGSADGTVRVGPVTGEEPHLLLGHEGAVNGLTISPDERWVASASTDAFYVWPMPDVTQPPLHTLPHGELLAKLDALTNLSVVRDPTSPTGWREEIGPFPGWKDVPTW